MSKNTNPDEKLARKRAAWLERTQQVFGVDELAARELLDVQRRQGVRLNPLCGDVTDTKVSLERTVTLGQTIATRLRRPPTA